MSSAYLMVSTPTCMKRSRNCNSTKRVGAPVRLETPGATTGVKRRVICRFWEFDQGGAWVVEELYDVSFEDVGWLLDFTESSETINGVVSNGRLQQVGGIGSEHDKHRQ